MGFFNNMFGKKDKGQQTTEQKKLRLTKLKTLENKAKSTRDYAGLIEIYDETMELVNAPAISIQIIPQKAYCLARLGRQNEAKETLRYLSQFQHFIDSESVVRAITLVSFFLQPAPSKLLPMQTETIKSWLQESKSSEQVQKILFDYEDIVGKIEIFDSSITRIRNKDFSQEIISLVFSAMIRPDDQTFYYNRQKNDVEMLVQGYLSTTTAKDKAAENKRLALRIINSDRLDPIIEDVHFLIPRLQVSDFLDELRVQTLESDEFSEWIEEFEEETIDEGYLDSFVFNEFSNSLDIWLNSNKEEKINIYKALQKTMDSFALDWLKEVN